jgi:CheY-like chemotaxis protein
MGGEMWVESKPGVGSTFHFTILAEAAPAQLRMQRSSESAEVNLAGKRALLVDDHPISLEILERQLAGWQMQTVSRDSGQAALELIGSGEKFDVVLMDQYMPEMDGMTLAARLRRMPEGKNLPLVMLTSLGTGMSEAKELNLSALLSKPVKQAHLHKVLHEVLASTPSSTPAAAQTHTLAVVTPQSSEHPSMRILLAEDNLVNQKVATHMLARMGYAIDIANNGVEVLQAMQQTHYHIILMDVQMPEMDGLEATRLIFEQWPAGERPYIIAMTAHALTGDAEKCLEAGMDDYVSKPVRRELLEEALEKASNLLFSSAHLINASPSYETNFINNASLF